MTSSFGTALLKHIKGARKGALLLPLLIKWSIDLLILEVETKIQTPVL